MNAEHAISACVITCDKQPKEVLYAAMKRIMWADEIVVADKGRDSLGYWDIETALGHFSPRLRLVREPWSPTVEPSRGAAAAACVHPWIIMLDDDEILSSDCERIFREFVSGENPSDILEIPIRNHVLGRFDRNAPYWPEWRPVLHRRGSLKFSDRVHGGVERLGRVLRLHEESPAYINHLSHASVSQYIEKTNRYTDQSNRTEARGRIETDYISAVAWLRQNYDHIDVLKRWEAANLPDGEAEFLRIAREVLDA